MSGDAPVPSRRGNRLEWIAFTALLALLGVDFGWPLHPKLGLAALAPLTVLTCHWGWLLIRGRRVSKTARHRLGALAFRLVLSCLAALVLSAKWWLLLGTGGTDLEQYVGSSRTYGVVLALLLTFGFMTGRIRFAKFVTLVADHPARLIAFSFGATGLLGGFLLSLPLSLQRVHELSMVDNLFMSFSAVCVTGLAVNTLSETYTPFGQGVLCLLIQIGGLGIMVFSAAIALVTGQRMRVRSSAMLAEMVDAESLAQLRRVVLGIVVSTLVIEALAALVFYLRFASQPELLASDGAPTVSTATVVGITIFHAVSAFCNAGFSNLPSGLIPFVGDAAVMGTVTSLIVLGGIGFPVIYELARRVRRWAHRRRQERMSLHCRISLWATALLWSGVSAAYLALEWTGALADLRWFERIYASVFQAASCRTAGFNVIDIGAMRPASLMLTCVVMFIGACPGSCGGGIKTTTVAVLFAGLRAELRGRPAYLLDRALSPATIRKAIGVAFLSIAILAVALFLLLLVETHAPLELAFEAFSAFSTTGLSTGVTPDLSTSGKLLVLCTMYIGRIGPMTLALALSGSGQAPRVQLPSERVLIG